MKLFMPRRPRSMNKAGTSHLRSTSVTAISQSMSAGSNFLIVLALGRFNGAAAVGDFAVALAVYTAFLGIQRASLTTPLMARAEGSTAALRDERARTLTWSLTMSLGVSIVLLAAGLGFAYPPIWILGIVLPGVLAQDALRYSFFRHRRPGRAALLDGIWVLGSCICFFVLRAHPSGALAVALWGVSGSVAALVGVMLLTPPTFSLRASFRWWHSSLWPSSQWLTVESMLYNVDLQIQAFGFTAMAGAAVFGAFQVAGSLVGIAFFITTGINMVLMTYFVSQDATKRSAVLVSVLNFSVIIVVTAALMAGSSFIVNVLYRGRVDVTTTLILAVGVYSALLAAAGGPYSLLLARRTEKPIPLARSALLIFAPLAVIVSKYNFEGAVWVLCLSAAVQLATLSFAAYRRRTPVEQYPQLRLAEPAMASSNGEQLGVAVAE